MLTGAPLTPRSPTKTFVILLLKLYRAAALPISAGLTTLFNQSIDFGSFTPWPGAGFRIKVFPH